MQINLIAEQASASLKELIYEYEDDIIKLMQDSLEESQLKEAETGKPCGAKINLSHSIVVDILERNQKDTLSFSLKRTCSIKKKLKDPNQPELEIE